MKGAAVTLAAGFHAVPTGHVAAVVTHLSMPRPERLPTPPGLPLRRVIDPDPGWYRDLFTRVGATDWLWFSRLTMDGDTLAATLRDPGVEVFALRSGSTDEGLLELDFRTSGTCELAFLGLTPAMQGRGHGRDMMDVAVSTAFARGVETLTVHTCTFDSPVALPFYIRAGFVPVRREIEVVPDPRLSGALPAAAAPHIPVLR